MSPPGYTATTEPLPGYQAGVGTRPLISKRAMLRHIMALLGCTGAEAQRWLAAVIRDAERPVVTAGAEYDLDKLERLMAEAPVARNRPVAKWQLGHGQWRTA